MSVKITGMGAITAEIERRLGKEVMDRIGDEAILEGAKVIKKELEKNFESFKDTGASQNEITISDSMPKSTGPSRTIHWRGPERRYALIHLNEWGTIKNPNPRGKGKVALSLQNAKKEYRKVLKNKLEEHL